MHQLDNHVRHFRFWCQKVLPLVYDDSLSYYEVLCKLSHKLNELVTFINEIPTYIDGVIEERLSDEHLEEILRQFVAGIQGAISANNEADNTNASKEYLAGTMLWWKDKLYRAMVDIPIGTTFVENANVEEVTFEELFNSFIDNIKHNITANDDGIRTTASKNWSKGDWLWLNDILYIVTSDITEGNAYVFTGANANVKRTTIEERTEVVYYANDKRLSLHSKISDYQQIVTAGDYHIYSPRREAIEIKKVE